MHCEGTEFYLPAPDIKDFRSDEVPIVTDHYILTEITDIRISIYLSYDLQSSSQALFPRKPDICELSGRTRRYRFGFIHMKQRCSLDFSHSI